MVSFEVGGWENVPAFPAHAQPQILSMWQEAHGIMTSLGTIISQREVSLFCKWPDRFFNVHDGVRLIIWENSQGHQTNTMLCCYYTGNLIQHSHKKHPILCQRMQDMGGFC